MNIQEILSKHQQWISDEEGGEWANLSGANLSGANLSWAILSRAVLSRAVLSGADLSWADLSWADLSEADLSRADLSGTNLSGANLSRADLSGTCLDPSLRRLQRQFVKKCPALRTGGRIVYRTVSSRHVGNTVYEPGRTYVAPRLSFDAATACHPGIYAASREWMAENYPGCALVECYVRDGDWAISAKGAIRCERLRVLRYV